MEQLTEFFKKLLDSSDWPPRWHCGKWSEFHGWLYIVSDLLIWSAYFTIPIVILRFIARKRNVLFVKLYILFAAFILACGATHFLDAVIFWFPVYRLSALVRFITGAVSWLTVFYLIKYLPLVFSLRSQAALEEEIEERKKTEQELKKSRKDYELLIDSVKDYSIFMLDKAGLVVTWNKGAQQLYGYTAAEAIGQPIQSFYPNEETLSEKLQNDLKTAFNDGRFNTEEYRLKKDGSFFWADIVLTPLYDDNNNFYGFVKLTRDITEKRKTEENVRFLASIADNIQDPVISTTHDESGKYIITTWNKPAEKLFEWTSEEVIGKDAAAILKTVYPYQTRAQILETWKANGFWQGELVYHTKSGKAVPVLSTLSFLKDAAGRITGNLILIKDITDRKKYETALNELNLQLEQRVKDRTVEIEKNEKRFKALLENNHDLISLYDDSLKTLYVSPSCSRITGWAEDEISRAPIHPGDMESVNECMIRATANPGIPQPFLWRYLHKQGHYIWLEGTVTKLSATDDVNGFVFNSKDVTERIKLENLLHKANTLARIGSWEVDLLNGTVYWSDITKDIHETGNDYIPDLQSGLNFYKEGFSRRIITQKVEAAIQQGIPWDVELQIITAKNNERWIRSIGEPEFLDGKCTRIYGSFQDIDQVKKAAEKIRNLNVELEEKVAIRTEELRKSVEELEAFSYSVSHDLRAPVRAIIGFARILEEEFTGNLGPEALRLTSIIKSNGAKMGLLIDDLLSFSRLSRQQIIKGKVLTEKMVADVIAETEVKNNGHQIKWIIHDLPEINADTATIKQVWINLVSNAVKYAGKQEQPTIEIGAENGFNETIFFIKDNGVGFDEQYADKLFKVFQRLHAIDEFEGTGVGLAIVDRIISKHGGRVWAHSKPGEGAIFYFSIPA